MKIYVHEKGIMLSGKAWEIKQKLKEYGNHYSLVKDWVETIHSENGTTSSYHKDHLHKTKTP